MERPELGGGDKDYAIQTILTLENCILCTNAWGLYAGSATRSEVYLKLAKVLRKLVNRLVKRFQHNRSAKINLTLADFKVVKYFDSYYPSVLNFILESYDDFYEDEKRIVEKIQEKIIQYSDRL